MAKVKLSATTIRIVKGYRNGTQRKFQYLPELHLLNDGELTHMTEQGYQAWLSSLQRQGFMVTVTEARVSYTGGEHGYKIFHRLGKDEKAGYAELRCSPTYYEWCIYYPSQAWADETILTFDDPDWVYDCNTRQEVKDMITEIIDGKINDEDEPIHLSKAERHAAIETAATALYEYYLAA